MESHGWVFLVFIPFFFFMIFRRRSWAHWKHQSDTNRKMKRRLQKKIRTGAKLESTDLDLSQDQELEEHRQYIDDLEKRVAELENRLDFTERLLTERRESVAKESGG
jgi:hypothetical protein